MKKIAAILTALLLFLGASAFAFTGTDYPAWDGAASPENSLWGGIGGQNLLLEFDAASEYSNVADGILQACFFAFDSKEQNYLELFLLLPEDAAAGDVFSPSSSGLSSISLYEVSMDSEVLYFAGQVGGFAYPDGSSFELRISSARKSGNSISMAGSISGTLVRFDGTEPGQETLNLDNVNFSFTLPLSSAPSSPGATQAPQATPLPESSAEPFQTRPPQAEPSAAPVSPKATMDPHPAFTLPPKYAVV